ncbi:MAG: glycosidase [Limisphaerales bacterium]|jgi:glycosidase
MIRHILSKFIFCGIVLCGLPTLLNAQVIWTDPLLPTADDLVTIYFDASEGNAELAGYSGAIYAHTGAIIDGPTGVTWTNVVGTWGTADPAVVMTALGGDQYSIQYTPRAFYSLAISDVLYRMAFVFRSEDGSLVGREADGSDIFTSVFLSGLNVSFIDPSTSPVITELGATVNVEIGSTDADSLFLLLDGVEIAATDMAGITMSVPAGVGGRHDLKAIAKTTTDSKEADVWFFTRPPVNVAAVPAGMQDGINEINDSTVLLVLYAPEKEHVFAIGDFNNWEPRLEGYMNQSPTATRYWIEITGIPANTYQAYQYLIDGDLQLADYYTELVLDPNNDNFINSSVFPVMPDYPEKGVGLVSVLRTAEPSFNWTDGSYSSPDQTRLTVYELLVRDFISKHDYNTLIDTLDYLQRLGINAIELMPICEFEGNLSWGYNPSFHGAVDKYYGNAESLKAFIDECHSRGIAVIQDVVFNHAFGQSPMVRMYWDGSTPALNSPWFNQNATHDFNVGYDFNHESTATRDYVKNILSRWVEDFHFDGFRFDLSKGFTQNFTVGDIGAWSAYDASRIAYLKEYADHLWSIDPDNYVILEHFASNDEEEELSEYGMMLWGNINHNYREAAMGYVDGSGSDLGWALRARRGWDDEHIIAYMESHDEERMQYSNTTWGNDSQAPTYDVTDLTTGLLRDELAAAFFFTMPGPKMLWQFGELGYDYSIDYNGRTGPKPIKWDYQDDDRRMRLYQIYSELIKLRNTHETFHTQDINYFVHAAQKRLNLNNPDMNATIIGNFDVTAEGINPSFQHGGYWYDYFSGDSLFVTDLTEIIGLLPGEWRIYTDVRLSTPDIISGIEDVPGPLGWSSVWPNPSSGQSTVVFELGTNTEVEAYAYDLSGKEVFRKSLGILSAGQQGIEWTAPAPGVYLFVIESEGEKVVNRIIAH